MASLQDQLLKAGMINKGKAQQIKKNKHKQRKQSQGNNTAEQAQAKALAEQHRQEKAARDLELNQRQQQAEQHKAMLAGVRQLLKQHSLERQQGEIPYQFVHLKKIKKIYISEAMQSDMNRGQVAIVDFDKAYHVLPLVIAEKIAERLPDAVIFLNQQPEDKPGEDDPYADYQIPDDLIW